MNQTSSEPLVRFEQVTYKHYGKTAPVHRDFWIIGLDGQRRHLKVTAFPLVGQAGRFLGAVALFWEGEAR